MHATGLAVRADLERRVAVITAQLEPVSSPYLDVRVEDQLADVIGRIDAELSR